MLYGRTFGTEMGTARWGVVPRGSAARISTPRASPRSRRRSRGPATSGDRWSFASRPIAPPTWAWRPSGECASLRCTKGQGDGDTPRWVSREGVDEVRFDDAAASRHERRALNARSYPGCVRRKPGAARKATFLAVAKPFD